MDREQRVEHHAGKASEAVRKILDRYQFELDVEETSIEYREDDHLLAQVGSDLEFVTSLAGLNDFQFWLDFSLSGGGLLGTPSITETAHFKPSPPREQDSPLGLLAAIRAPDSSVTLRLNDGSGASNVFSFEFDSDSEVPNQSGALTRIDFDSAEESDTEISKPTTQPLGTQLQPSQTRSRRFVTAGSIEEAQIAHRAALNDASWSISARAETSVHALGGLVHAHDVIQLTGAGSVASGDYFVRSVTHHINPADHTLSIELLRNALGN
jgi:phage protein D